MDNELNRIRLHRDTLEEILRMVDYINPVDSCKLGSGYVEIKSEACAGIGQIISASVPVDLGDGHYGHFTKTVENEESW